ncbi:cytochrome c(L), periplasmic [Azospirillum sp. HJ39]|uniref:cytochrome c(L), periplasmic n=1 Tax=Azospirillum sp. HJ39 TaxID=3159496 RepID=UPI0035573020
MNRKTILRIALGGVLGAVGTWGAQAALTFNNTVTGEVLDLSHGLPEGRDTPAVKTFLETGNNPYNENASCLPVGAEIFLSACSGCHGHVAEGKIGPGLNDDYWTYPKNTTDKGLFETVFGGAQGQMGPQYGALSLNDILLVMAWVRHVYTGPPGGAEWLSEDQRRAFKPYSSARVETAQAPAEPGQCRAAVN